MKIDWENSNIWLWLAGISSVVFWGWILFVIVRFVNSVPGG